MFLASAPALQTRTIYPQSAVHTPRSEPHHVALDSKSCSVQSCDVRQGPPTPAPVLVHADHLVMLTALNSAPPPLSLSLSPPSLPLFTRLVTTHVHHTLFAASTRRARPRTQVSPPPCPPRPLWLPQPWACPVAPALGCPSCPCKRPLAPWCLRPWADQSGLQ
jgi:hypothetical protein